MDLQSARAYKNALDGVRTAIDQHEPGADGNHNYLPAHVRFELLWSTLEAEGHTSTIDPNRSVLIGQIANEFMVVIIGVDEPHIGGSLQPRRRTITANWHIGSGPDNLLTSEMVSTHDAMDETPQTIRGLGLLEESVDVVLSTPNDDRPEIALDIDPST